MSLRAKIEANDPGLAVVPLLALTLLLIVLDSWFALFVYPVGCAVSLFVPGRKPSLEDRCTAEAPGFCQDLWWRVLHIREIAEQHRTAEFWIAFSRTEKAGKHKLDWLPSFHKSALFLGARLNNTTSDEIARPNLQTFYILLHPFTL